MTVKEYLYIATESVAAVPHHVLVRQELKRLLTGGASVLLDVGGRGSPYTVGLPCRVTVTDLPRATAIQEALGLGVTTEMEVRLRASRSNIACFKFDDMTKTCLSQDYDAVVAVEVLEHVAEDERFVANVRRVLRSRGTFLMTTPNGLAVPNHNPDHKRHYTPQELRALLNRYFEHVEVRCAIAAGWIQFIAYRSALRNWYASAAVLGCRLAHAVRFRAGSWEAGPEQGTLLVATAR